jgi:hypothetical protein
MERDTQTKSLQFFVIHRPTILPSTTDISSNRHRSTNKIHSTSLSKEVIIVDKLISDIEKRMVGKGTCGFLRNPLKFKIIFDKKAQRLSLNFKSGIEMLRETLLINDFSLVSLFEESMISLIDHRPVFFDLFHKYVYNQNRTIMDGFAAFLMFLSNYLKGKYIAFIMEFLFIILHVAFQKNTNPDNIRNFVRISLIDHTQIIRDAQEKFQSLFGCDRNVLIDPGLLFLQFGDYLFFYDFLSCAPDLKAP